MPNVAGWLLAAAWLPGCAEGSDAVRSVVATPSESTRPDRPAEYRVCTPIQSLGEGWELVDRALPNLGDGYLGRSYTYSSGPRRFEVYAGVAVLEAYEDLDFTQADVSFGPGHGELYRAGAFGTDDDLLVLTWTQPDRAGPCSNLTAVGTNLSEGAFLEMVAELAT